MSEIHKPNSAPSGEEQHAELWPEVVIDPEFECLICRQSEAELAELKSSLLLEGCRDQLVAAIFPDLKEAIQRILLDGHARRELCIDNKIPYRVLEKPFSSREAAKEWSIRNQLGRRNLTLFARAELALKLEDVVAAKAKGQQGARTDLPGGPSLEPIETMEELAKAAGASHDTIRKVKALIASASPEILEDLRSGNTSINSAYTMHITPRKQPSQGVAQKTEPAKSVAESATGCGTPSEVREGNQPSAAGKEDEKGEATPEGHPAANPVVADANPASVAVEGASAQPATTAAAEVAPPPVGIAGTPESDREDSLGSGTEAETMANGDETEAASAAISKAADASIEPNPISYGRIKTSEFDAILAGAGRPDCPCVTIEASDETELSQRLEFAISKYGARLVGADVSVIVIRKGGAK